MVDDQRSFVIRIGALLLCALVAAAMLLFDRTSEKSITLGMSRHRSLQLPPYIQADPIKVNGKITVVGTNFEAAADAESLKISMSRNTEPGDMLALFVGGSGGPNRRPGEPSGEKWTKIMDVGRNDLNLCSYYKFYKDDGDDNDFRIEGGKNTFSILSTLRGVDKRYPIVDYAAQSDTMAGREGAALAPSIFGVEKGAIIGTFVYDDPQVARVTNTTFEMLATSDTGRGDGMAAAVASTDFTGYVGTIHALGSREKGGGNDAAAAISFRADGGPYIIPPPPTPVPTTLWREEDTDIDVENLDIFSNNEPGPEQGPVATPTSQPTRPRTYDTNTPSKPPTDSTEEGGFASSEATFISPFRILLVTISLLFAHYFVHI